MYKIWYIIRLTMTFLNGQVVSNSVEKEVSLSLSSWPENEASIYLHGWSCIGNKWCFWHLNAYWENMKHTNLQVSTGAWRECQRHSESKDYNILNMKSRTSSNRWELPSGPLVNITITMENQPSMAIFNSCLLSLRGRTARLEGLES